MPGASSAGLAQWLRAQALSNVEYIMGSAGERVLWVFLVASAWTLKGQGTHTCDWAEQE